MKLTFTAWCRLSTKATFIGSSQASYSSTYLMCKEMAMKPVWNLSAWMFVSSKLQAEYFASCTSSSIWFDRRLRVALTVRRFRVPEASTGSSMTKVEIRIKETRLHGGATNLQAAIRRQREQYIQERQKTKQRGEAEMYLACYCSLKQ